MRLRWGDWRTSKIIQVHVGPAAAFEDYRADCFAQGRDHTGDMPPHFALDGPSHHTALALLRHRNNEEMLIKVNYLAAMMEALVNTPCAILRTDLIRRVYREVDSLGKELKNILACGGGAFPAATGRGCRQAGSFSQPFGQPGQPRGVL